MRSSVSSSARPTSGRPCIARITTKRELYVESQELIRVAATIAGGIAGGLYAAGSMSPDAGPDIAEIAVAIALEIEKAARAAVRS